MTMEILEPDNKNTKIKPGIKNFRFTASGTNGEAHRRNASKKRRQHAKNAQTRADHYSAFQGEKGWKSGSSDCDTWHTVLKGLSQGTA